MSMAWAILARSFSLRPAPFEPPPIAIRAIFSIPNRRKSGFAQSLQFGRIAKRHHAAAGEEAAAGAVARSGGDDEAAKRRQAHRERCENDHGPARVIRRVFQQEQDADHRELADRECRDDTGLILERRQQSREPVKAFQARQ